MRVAAGVLAGVVAAAGTSAAQSADLAARILSTGSRTVVSFDALAADVARADVVFLNEQASAPGVHRVELALLEALARRRPDVVFALDAITRASQEPLEHFQMGHLSDQELVAEAGIPSALALAYLPLLKFAAARTWPIVATGPAEAAGEEQMSAVIVQAAAIGAAGGKRPLLVSLHASSPNGVSERSAERARRELLGRRVLTLRFESGTPSEPLTPAATPSPNADYVIYAAL